MSAYKHTLCYNAASLEGIRNLSRGGAVAKKNIVRLVSQLQDARGWSDSQLARELNVEDAELAAMKEGGYVEFDAGIIACALLGIKLNRETLLDLVGYKPRESIPPYSDQNRNFIEKLDLLKRKRQWTDAELALQIGLSNPQHLTKIRTGERPIPFEVKIRAWDLLGYAMSRDVLLGLLPEKFSSRIVEADNRRNRMQVSDQDDQEDR
jgi:transcriptional regulator with XRE-family HTH domain